MDRGIEGGLLGRNNNFLAHFLRFEDWKIREKERRKKNVK